MSNRQDAAPGRADSSLLGRIIALSEAEVTGEVEDAADGALTCARIAPAVWASIFAISLCNAGCSQPTAIKSQAAKASAAAVAPVAPPSGNAAPSASNSPASSISPTNAAASDTLPTAVTPPFSETFEQYPAGVFQGPVVYPDFTGAQKQYADFRSRLTNGVKGGVNFAGHYSMVLFGCGLFCTTGYMIDLTNGQVAPVPFGNMANMGIEFRYRPNSTLMETAWRSDMSFDANGNPLNDPNPTCVFENLLWQGGKWKILDQIKTPGMCP